LINFVRNLKMAEDIILKLQRASSTFNQFLGALRVLLGPCNASMRAEGINLEELCKSGESDVFQKAIAEIARLRAKVGE
jgi:hypothetical protein